ncbi:MAG: flagellar basal body P-ring protein FlgI [Deltaproteobacteria bacterium]|nr:flagellar basal body P-ring protein FlgI [Deltaproteobacteria bacterium]
MIQPLKVWILLLGMLLLPGFAFGARIKDLVNIEGVRDNQLLGYGLVIGLDGTGDDTSTIFTNQSLASMLQRLGVTVNPAKVKGIKAENVASVMVTTTLPPFARNGNRLDIKISSIGNASSLRGGTLLMTPLKGPDGKVYAVAQGEVSVGGFSFGGASGGGVQKNHPTVGVISGGALVEREVPMTVFHQGRIRAALRTADFCTANRIAKAVNQYFGAHTANALDGGTLEVMLPKDFQNNPVSFISRLEAIDVAPDTYARVVLNERTGTVVMGEHVRISTVAISHGNLSIEIKERVGVSQPRALASGKTVTVPDTTVKVSEEKRKLMLVPAGVSIGEVVRGLNSIGVSPSDLIAIFQAIKAAGALQAELKII